jgi:hypothetical protein
MRRLVWLIALAGCSSGEATPPDLAAPIDANLGTPLDVPPDQWTWVDFPGSACSDGSPTGIGVYRSSTSSNLLVYLNGGGACWDYLTCYTLHTAILGPFGKTQFDGLFASLAPGSIFDRSLAENPFSDWSWVFVPYCTGDLHAGDRVIDYGADGGPPFHHVGRDNLVAFLARLLPTFPSPGKLVLAGSSAGGYGAALNYATVRATWPGVETYLLDDSGPLLETSAIPPAEYAAWQSSWKLDALLQGQCGASCVADWSLIFPSLAGQWPNDRWALLSSLQDSTISGYFGLSGAQFQSALGQLAADRIAPAAGGRSFFVTGSTHTMLFSAASFTSGTTPLWTWLGQMVGDDPAWASKP